MALTAVFPTLQARQSPSHEQVLAADHRTVFQFAQTVGPADLVVSTGPEVFLNQGKRAMNGVFATEHTERQAAEFGEYEHIYY